jgi:biotin carboxylase
VRLTLIARNPTDSVTLGFLPAAAGLGLRVTLLTDAPDDHRRAYTGRPHAPEEIAGCDVRDFRELVGVIAGRPRPDAVFSNSDHLQAQTALAAAYLGLPAKDWRAALRAKNKALMRRHLAALGLDAPAVAEVPAGEDPAALAVRPLPYPLVVKPREGVASEDVVLVHGAGEVVARCREIQARRPGEALVVEEFLAGELRTLETLGDGRALRVLGGFRTTLSAPPHFVEERLDWAPDLPVDAREALLAQLGALGAGLGACHTEFVLDGGVPRLIEVNYRLVGDQVDLLLADLLGRPLFEQVLRVHLGERLSAETPRPDGHGLADYVVAGRAGTLVDAPGPMDVDDGGVRLRYRPLRPAGDRVALTHTNRDYLGVIRATGPDRRRVEAAVGAFRAGHRWEIVP